MDPLSNFLSNNHFFFFFLQNISCYNNQYYNIYFKNYISNINHHKLQYRIITNKNSDFAARKSIQKGHDRCSVYAKVYSNKCILKNI